MHKPKATFHFWLLSQARTKPLQVKASGCLGSSVWVMAAKTSNASSQLLRTHELSAVLKLIKSLDPGISPFQRAPSAVFQHAVFSQALRMALRLMVFGEHPCCLIEDKSQRPNFHCFPLPTALMAALYTITFASSPCLAGGLVCTRGQDEHVGSPHFESKPSLLQFHRRDQTKSAHAQRWHWHVLQHYIYNYIYTHVYYIITPMPKILEHLRLKDI